MRFALVLLLALTAVAGCSSAADPTLDARADLPPTALDTGVDLPRTLDRCAKQPDGQLIIYCCDFCPRADMNASAGAWAQGTDGVCLPFCHSCFPDSFTACTPPP